MIPTLILLGLVFGHWWKTTLAVGTVGWVVLLMTDSMGMDYLTVIFGFASTLAGILLHQLAAHVVRRMRDHGAADGVRSARSGDLSRRRQ